MTPETSREYLDERLDSADMDLDTSLRVIYGRLYATKLWCILGRSQGYGLGAARVDGSRANELEPLAHVALSSFDHPRVFRLRPVNCPPVVAGDGYESEIRGYNRSAEFPEDNP